VKRYVLFDKSEFDLVQRCFLCGKGRPNYVKRSMMCTMRIMMMRFLFFYMNI